MMAKVQPLKVSFGICRHVKRESFACLDKGQRAKLLGSRMTANGLRGLHTEMIYGLVEDGFKAVEA